MKKGVTGFWLQKDRVHHGGDTMVAVGGGGDMAAEAGCWSFTFSPTHRKPRENPGDRMRLYTFKAHPH